MNESILWRNWTAEWFRSIHLFTQTIVFFWFPHSQLPHLLDRMGMIWRLTLNSWIEIASKTVKVDVVTCQYSSSIVQITSLCTFTVIFALVGSWTAVSYINDHFPKNFKNMHPLFSKQPIMNFICRAVDNYLSYQESLIKILKKKYSNIII